LRLRRGSQRAGPASLSLILVIQQVFLRSHGLRRNRSLPSATVANGARIRPATAPCAAIPGPDAVRYMSVHSRNHPDSQRHNGLPQPVAHRPATAHTRKPRYAHPLGRWPRHTRSRVSAGADRPTRQERRTRLNKRAPTGPKGRTRCPTTDNRTGPSAFETTRSRVRSPPPRYRHPDAATPTWPGVGADFGYALGKTT